jgi:hypothetical protein
MCPLSACLLAGTSVREHRVVAVIRAHEGDGVGHCLKRGDVEEFVGADAGGVVEVVGLGVGGVGVGAGFGDEMGGREEAEDADWEGRVSMRVL